MRSRAGHAGTVYGPPATVPAPLPAQSFRLEPLHLIPAVRYGRYTLVELSPDGGQQDLMQQIVDVTMPAAFAATVGDALGYVLLRSGFSLCDSPQIRILNTLPLPATDLHLGPLTLKSALRILAGPGWKLEVNEVTRRICFTPVTPSSPSGKSASLTLADPSNALSAARPLATPPEHRP
ncbi:MAG: PilL N-terminal domain-containing protein [Steroidobacteraceae bacterium]